MFMCQAGFYNSRTVHRLIAILHLPKFALLEQVFGLRLQQVLWLPSYSLLQGSFFKHAMSTPVTTLAGYLDASLIESSKKRKQLLLKARIICKTVENLVSELATPSITNATFSLYACTEECIRVCRILYPTAAITFSAACVRSTRLVGSEIHWKEALHCAIRNAVEAYDSDATICPVTVLLYQNSTALRVEIIDCAAGMSLLARILVRLPGITAKRQGSGLGLSFVRYVVQDLFAGKIEIDSRIDRGTHVRWVLPLQASDIL